MRKQFGNRIFQGEGVGQIKAGVLLTALLLTLPLTASAAEYVIHAGRIFDGLTEEARPSSTVVIRDGAIVLVADGLQPAADGQTVIDLRQYTLLPGMIDVHVHLSGQQPVDPGPDDYTRRFYRSRGLAAMVASAYAKSTLFAGFTTVRDMGGTLALDLRDAIDQGHIDGPRIFAAGTAIGIPGGHADLSSGLNEEFGRESMGPEDGIISGPLEARRAVRERIKEGADVIKIVATAGVYSQETGAENPQLMPDEVYALVETAAYHGMPTACHAHGGEGILLCAEAQVNSIEHATFMTPAGLDAMKAGGIYYVPTLSSGRRLLANLDKLPSVMRPKAREVGLRRPKTFAAAYKAGLKIAFGTDSYSSPHGENAKEFIYMVEGGMSPSEAIRSATIDAATLLRIQDRAGTIESGKLADLVAVKGNPLEDIRRMTEVIFVMKDGQIYKQPSQEY